MGRSTAVGSARSTAVALTAAVAAGAGPVPLGADLARAHSEGLTPYWYVKAPAGVRSQGTPVPGVSTQPIGRPGFAGTTDNQVQLTLPAGALPRRRGETGVRVTLEQLDPAALPPLPAGLEPEGNGYRVQMRYASSQRRLPRLSEGAVLSLAAPAAPTGLLELVDGAWRPTRSTRSSAAEGFSSVMELRRPGTYLQVHDPSRAPASTGKASSAPASSVVVVVAPVVLLVVLAGVLGVARHRRRPGPTPPG